MHGALYRDCQRCGGYGSFGHGDMIKCPACHGNGVIALSTEEMAAINAPIMAGKGRREAGASFVERFREAVGEDAWASIPEYLQIWIMTKAISVHLGLSTPPVVSGELVAIEGDQIVIRVPIDALPEACAIAWDSSLGEHGITISDLPVFAKEFVRELRREEENGDTLVHKMLDRAAYMAANNGAEGLSE